MVCWLGKNPDYATGDALHLCSDEADKTG